MEDSRIVSVCIRQHWDNNEASCELYTLKYALKSVALCELCTLKYALKTSTAWRLPGKKLYVTRRRLPHEFMSSGVTNTAGSQLSPNSSPVQETQSQDRSDAWGKGLWGWRKKSTPPPTTSTQMAPTWVFRVFAWTLRHETNTEFSLPAELHWLNW